MTRRNQGDGITAGLLKFGYEEPDWRWRVADVVDPVNSLADKW